MPNAPALAQELYGATPPAPTPALAPNLVFFRNFFPPKKLRWTALTHAHTLGVCERERVWVRCVSVHNVCVRCAQ